MTLLEQVLEQLDGVECRHLRHAASRTTAELAAARGCAVDVGLKALLMKVRGEWTTVVVRAHERTDNRVVRRALRSQKLRFLRSEELASLALEPGQVPPFGRPVLPCRLVADRGVLDGDAVAFTAGTWTDSLVMATSAWIEVAKPELFDLVGRGAGHDG